MSNMPQGVVPSQMGFNIGRVLARARSGSHVGSGDAGGVVPVARHPELARSGEPGAHGVGGTQRLVCVTWAVIRGILRTASIVTPVAPCD